MIKHRAVAATLVRLAACALIAIVAPALARERHAPSAGDSAGRFDYFLMALSWSPSYCLTHRDEREQCGDKGFGFVLHGLWPESRDGKWIEHCRSKAAPEADTIARTLAFMPSRRLIEHEWSTHGSCTGLDPAAYFELADRAFAGVRIPPALRTPQSPPLLSASDVVDAFAAANPGLDRSMMSVECHNGYQLTEVRVCLDKTTLAPQACGGRVRNTCRSGNLRIPAAR